MKNAQSKSNFPEKETPIFENKLIQKGLNDFATGNISTHEEVKARFKRKFAKYY
jgi:hypothetical protein